MNNKEYSKQLLKQESALIWIMSLSFIVLAFYCIHEGFTGSLPWLAAMVGFPWTAYGVSQAMYYRKSMAENTEGGLKYQKVLAEVQSMAAPYQQVDNQYDSYLYEDGIDPYANDNEEAYVEEVYEEFRENVDDYQI